MGVLPRHRSFALRRTAEDNETNTCEKVIHTVYKNFYVDDLCKSFSTVEEAVEMIKQLCTLLKSGGFHLTKFVSNSKSFLETIPNENLASNVLNFADRELPIQKALGIYWDAETDRLQVKVKIRPQPHTRRGLLSMIGQTYDPLGLLQPFLLPARRVLQQACRMGLPWDEVISNAGVGIDDWDQWLKSLPCLESISLPRSFKFLGGDVKSIELHVFCDASLHGYSACAYFRIVYHSESIKCLFVLGKCRIAPLKSLTVPRLELSAAVVAVKLAHTVRQETEYVIDRIVFWTDASVVLRYIQNTSSRYMSFVANRLELIHTLSTPQQWRYVPTDLNPADIGSRGVSPDKTDLADMWLHGPPFLVCCEREWPKQPFLSEFDDCDDPELKKVKVSSNSLLRSASDSIHHLLRRYSDITRLRRSVVWLTRFMLYLKWKRQPERYQLQTGTLTVAELDKSTEIVVRLTQGESFPLCLNALPDCNKLSSIVPVSEQLLRNKPCLRKLQALNPCKVNGILRVGGRLQNSPLDKCAKHPILLPTHHHVTKLLILEIHTREGHLGCNHIINAIRERYWILKGRTAVKSALKECINCRFWKAKPGKQQMGELPVPRVTLSAPFATCGTDLMGPLFVKIGRSSCKRYVCIFSCMATRAVHFEVVQSLESSAFIQAFRRFCNRRITRPKVMYSDNGGNFVMADKELNDGIKIWNSKNFQNAMVQNNIEWRFNPPLASHQGGFYERYFRIVRKVLRSIVGEATLEEKDLLTLLTEVERTLNNRPISETPSSPDELQHSRRVCC